MVTLGLPGRRARTSECAGPRLPAYARREHSRRARDRARNQLRVYYQNSNTRVLPDGEEMELLAWQTPGLVSPEHIAALGWTGAALIVGGSMAVSLLGRRSVRTPDYNDATT